jgi:hypothetical protein
MRTVFWASSALLLASCSQKSGPAQAPAPDAAPAAATSIQASVENGETRLDIHAGSGKTYVVHVKRDDTVAPESEPTSVNVIGEIKNTSIVLTDTYPSIPGGMSYCQAGEEQFLRVISIAKEPATESLQVKAGSCRGNIELASPGIEWAPESSSIRVHWLLGPKGDSQPEERTIHIGPDGSAS